MLLNYIKRGAYTTFFYGFNSLITRAVSFIFLPYLLSRISLQEFGIWDFYQVFFSTGTLILSSCAASSMIRFYIFYKDNKEKQRQSVGNALVLTFALSSIFPCFCYCFNYYSPGIVSFSHYLILTISSISFFSLFTVFLAYIRMQEKLVLYTVFSVGQNLLAILGTVVGLHFNWGIDAFFYANLISYMLFFPCIIYVLINNNSYCFSLFKEQLSYGLPLLIYALIYALLFSIDKMCIQHYLGYEILGLYALLWRFGSIFQMLAIAMIDAWYIVLYNLQKEENADPIITKLIRYYALVLASCALAITYASILAIKLIFPLKYQHCVHYIPFFFIPLLLIEIARLFQTAFGLSTKTFYMPFLTAITCALQLILVRWSLSYGIWGVLFANAVAYLWYILSSYLLSYYAYPQQLIDIQKIAVLLLNVVLNVGLCSYFFSEHYWLFISVSSLLWPSMCWYSGLITDDEKEWLVERGKNFYTEIYLLRKKQV